MQDRYLFVAEVAVYLVVIKETNYNWVIGTQGWSALEVQDERDGYSGAITIKDSQGDLGSEGQER